MKKVLSLFLSILMLCSITAGVDLSALAANNYTVSDISDIEFVAARDIYLGIDSYMNGVGANITYADGETDYIDFLYDYNGNGNQAYLNDIKDSLGEMESIETEIVSGTIDEIGTVTVSIKMTYPVTCEQTLQINVVQSPVESISVTGDLTKTVYHYNLDDIARTDLVINYTDGTSTDLESLLADGWSGWGYDDDDGSCSWFVPNAPGEFEAHGNHRHRIEYYLGMAEPDLIAGETYPLTIRYMGCETTTYVTITDENASDDSDYFSKYCYFTGEEIICEFTAANSNVYSFYMWLDADYSEDTESNRLLQICDSDGNCLRTIYPEYGQSAYLYLQEGETVTLKYNDYNSETDENGYEIGIFVSESTEQYILGYDNMTAEAGQYIYFAANGEDDESIYNINITPAETATYWFDSEYDTEGEIYIYSSDDELLGSCSLYGSSYGIDLEAGEEYTARIVFYGNYAALGIRLNDDSGITITDWTYVDLGEIVLDETMAVNVNAGEIFCFSFTPEESGTYTFYLTGDNDTYGGIYRLDDGVRVFIAEDDDSGDSMNFSVSYVLTAGETYYLYCRLYNSIYGGSFGVTVISGTYSGGSEDDGDSDFYYTVFDDGTAEITGYKYYYAAYVEIPETIDGYTVTSIGSWAFEGFENIVEITIPDTVTSIGWGAFADCTGLESITIPDSVTGIGMWAFDDCTSLTSIYIWNADCEIYDSEYTISDTATIYGFADSTAQAYAEKYDRDFGFFGVIVIPGHTHTYSSTVTTAATCTAKGVRTYTCTECGDSYTEEIPATGHTAVTDAAVAATCTTAGKTAGSHCSVCGAVITAQETVAPTGNHKWNSGTVTKAATCTATGVKTYTCTVCGTTKTEKINATGHTAVTDAAVAATCTTAGKTAGSHCKTCGKVLTAQTTVAATGHSYTTVKTKATTDKKGVLACKNCGAIKNYAKIKSVSLSASTYTYNGNAKKPTVTVKDADGNTISSKYYTVTYVNQSTGKEVSQMKSVGKYYVKVKFKTRYSGTVKKTVTIKPKSTSISSVTANSKGVTVKWSKVTTGTTGYQVQYSTSSDFSSKTTKTISGNSTTSKKITGLKAKKKYYVRVRTYKTVKIDGKSTKIYSSWSKAKSVTTKK